MRCDIIIFDDVEGREEEDVHYTVQWCTVVVWLNVHYSVHCQMIPQFSPDGSADGWSFALNLPSQGL